MPSSRKKYGGAVAAVFCFLLLTEGLAVSTLVLSRIHLVGAHKNALQRTVIRITAVVSALLNGAFNALVCVFFHLCLLLFP